MNLDEKKQKANDYVASNLSWASYIWLYVFNINVRYMKRLIELSRVVSHRIESGDIKSPANPSEISRINQLVLLDSLSNLMMTVEATLVLCSVLSERRIDGIKIVERMLRYDQNRIDAFIDRLKCNKVNVWRLAGFPNTATLKKNCGLTELERKCVQELLQESCDLIKRSLDQITDFYQKNRTIYGKFKHGLAFLLGFEIYPQSEKAPRGLSSTAILALDRKARQSPETCASVTAVSEHLSWFNTISVLQYSNETKQKHNGILVDVENLVAHITNNHLLCAENCGEDYFPAEQQNGIWKAILYLSRDLSEEEQTVFESVAHKVFTNLHTINRSAQLEFKLRSPILEKVYECLLRDSVATIFSNTDQEETRASRTLLISFIRRLARNLIR